LREPCGSDDSGTIERMMPSLGKGYPSLAIRRIVLCSKPLLRLNLEMGEKPLSGMTNG
jgi:hypothetical protein